jgi:tetratricopeptide (TPR) repeat protein
MTTNGSSRGSSRGLKPALAAGLVLVFCLAASAQQADIAQLKNQVETLKSQSKFTEMLPLLEKILVAEPDNAQMHFYYGFALIGQGANTSDVAERKALRVRAHKEFIRAKELKINEPIIDAMILAVPEDGADPAAFSKDPRANALMIQAEAFFAQGKMDEALKAYQMALNIDPKLYHAALFCGDVYVQTGDYANAEIWYQKAIAIDPNLETAYRYSATPLMKQGKTAEALKRYVEAFITEPYSRFAAAGLAQWANITRTSVGHPRIDVPNDWSSYNTTRSAWQSEKFLKAYPGEKTYRHSLAEESDALRSVISTATAEQKSSSAFTTLKKLNDDGYLEAYILLARADGGIAQDYPEYLRQHRDKLRDYVEKYVIGPSQ